MAFSDEVVNDGHIVEVSVIRLFSNQERHCMRMAWFGIYKKMGDHIILLNTFNFNLFHTIYIVSSQI